MVKIAPSLLSADFANLAEELKDIECGGADLVHLDIMDGHFVPNLTFGAPVIKALRPHTNLTFDAHLMVYHPENYVKPLADAGVNMVSFHVEAAPHADRIVHMIKDAGMKAGIVLNPATSLSTVDYLLEIVDYVLLMSVNPGFGGQKFISYTMDKVRSLRSMISERHLNCQIEIDGGVKAENAGKLAEAGADILVAGSAVFGKEDRKAAIAALR